MNTVVLDDAELAMARHALHAYLGAFGHDEADTRATIRAVLAKLDAVDGDAEGATRAG